MPKLCQNSQIMLLIFEIMLTKWRRFCTYRRAKTTPKYNVFQICCCWKFICVLWQFVSALSCPNRARRICQKRPSNKACQNKVNTTISEAKTRIVKTYYLNLIYFCRKYTIFTKFYEFMLQKVLKFANYAVAVLVYKIMLFCSNYAKNYANTIRQGLV